MSRPIVSVVGLGRLGMPFAACLAARGLRVIGVDVDPAKVDAVNQGDVLGCEPMLAETLARAGATLSATGDLEEAVRASDTTFVFVQTPESAAGQISSEFVRAACRDIGKALGRKSGYHVVAVASTMAPGTMEEVVLPMLERASGKVCGRDFGICYAPEFVALGSLVDGFLNPPFVLIGEHDERAGAMLAGLLGAAFARPPEIIRCSMAAAELAKIALNAFLAMKISFANLLARTCERGSGVDVDEVTAILERDPRVGRGFLQGRLSFGGPCLPRDLMTLKQIAESVGVDPSLATAVARINVERLRDVERLVRDRARTLARRRRRSVVVGILGLAFKPGTDSAEHAPGVLLSERLSALGMRVIAHDPEVTTQPAGVVRAATADDCVRDADLLVIATPWPAYAELAAERLTRTIVIDCWRVLPPATAAAAAEYVCLGTGGLFDPAAQLEPRLEVVAEG